MRRSLVSAIVVAAFLAACGGGGDDAGVTLTATAADSTVVAGESVELTIAVEGLELVDPETATTAVDGQGHYHVYLDDAAGSDYLWMGITPTATVEIPVETTAGAHTLRVQAAGNDHVLLEDVAAVTIPITVEAAALPTLEVTSDVDTVANGGTVTLTFVVTNFTLSPEHVGGVNVPGEGHYHVAIEGTTAYEVGATPTLPFVVETDAPGAFTINVSLRNNDHGAYQPVVETSLPLTVTD